MLLQHFFCCCYNHNISSSSCCFYHFYKLCTYLLYFKRIMHTINDITSKRKSLKRSLTVQTLPAKWLRIFLLYAPRIHCNSHKRFHAVTRLWNSWMGYSGVCVSCMVQQWLIKVLSSIKKELFAENYFCMRCEHWKAQRFLGTWFYIIALRFTWICGSG